MDGWCINLFVMTEQQRDISHFHFRSILNRNTKPLVINKRIAKPLEYTVGKILFYFCINFKRDSFCNFIVHQVFGKYRKDFVCYRFPGDIKT